MTIAESPFRWPLSTPSRRNTIWSWLAAEFAMPALLATPPRAPGTVTLPAPLLGADIIRELANIIGPDRVRQDDATRAAHARGRSYQDQLRTRAGDFLTAPDAVLFPRGEEEVAALLKFCAARSIGVVPFGSGLGIAGGVSTLPGRVSLDLSGMDRLIATDMLAGIVTVEAGISLPVLEKLLAVRGMTLGVPAQGSLGGWIAQSLAAEEALVGARMMTAQDVLTFDGPSSGIKHMILGSEGAHGVITQATLRILPLASRRVRTYYLRDMASGLAALRTAPRHLDARLYDAPATRFTRKTMAFEKKRRDWWGDLMLALRRFDSRACLLTITFADETSARRMDGLIRKLDGIAASATPDHEFPESLLDHGAGMQQFEAWASWSKLPVLHANVARALESAMHRHAPRPGARGQVLTHISTASQTGAKITLRALFARTLQDEMDQARAIKQAGLDEILRTGGSIAGYGTGAENLPWVIQEKGAAALSAARAVKAALDPQNILNPGKLIAPEIP